MGGRDVWGAVRGEAWCGGMVEHLVKHCGRPARGTPGGASHSGLVWLRWMSTTRPPRPWTALKWGAWGGPWVSTCSSAHARPGGHASYDAASHTPGCVGEVDEHDAVA